MREKEPYETRKERCLAHLDAMSANELQSETLRVLKRRMKSNLDHIRSFKERRELFAKSERAEVEHLTEESGDSEESELGEEEDDFTDEYSKDGVEELDLAHKLFILVVEATNHCKGAQRGKV